MSLGSAFRSRRVVNHVFTAIKLIPAATSTAPTLRENLHVAISCTASAVTDLADHPLKYKGSLAICTPVLMQS